MEAITALNQTGTGAQGAPGGDAAKVEAPVAAPRPSQAEPRRDGGQELPGDSPEITEKNLTELIDGVNAVMKNSGSHAHFVKHEHTERIMVELKDNETQEVIKTIPPKELLDLAAKIGEMLGVLLDEKT